MGRLYRELHGDDENKSSSSSSSVTDALLFATICIVGLPVDAHVKDGSVYSGIFYTACFENDCGIVLKKARMTKKGKANSNIANGALIETLVILSGDLVQLVAKGVLLPADGSAGNPAGKDEESVVDIRVPCDKCTGNDGEKPIKSAFDSKRTEEIRSSVQKENGFALGSKPTNGEKDHEGRKAPAENLENVLEVRNGTRLHQVKEASTAEVNERNCGCSGLQGEKTDVKEKLEFPTGESIIKAEGLISSSDTCIIQIKPAKEGQIARGAKLPSSEASCGPPSLPEQSFERPMSADASSCAVTPNVSTSTSQIVDVKLESSHSSVAMSTETVPSHLPQSNKSSKESRLNPGAKIFSPSFRSSIPATPAAQTVAGTGYMPNNSPVIPVPAAQPEVGLSPFGSHSSVPVKILPYGNLPAGTVGTTQFIQPLIGHVGSRPQPLGYAVQYPIQGGPGIMHSNSQSVSVGRLGQLVYVHPASQELVPGVTAISSPFAHPLPTPHQVQFSKQQGNAAGPAMQLCVAPPLVASGQQPPYAVPCHIPILQPSFPSNRYIQAPGSHGPLNSKFL